MKIGFSIKYLDRYYNWILPFIKASKGQNEFFLFHVDRLYNNIGQEGMEVESIDLTRKIFLKRELRKIDLDVMVFFTPGQILDVYIMSICKEMNIKTVYFQHGLGLDLTSFDPKTLNQDKSLKTKFTSIKRFSFFLFFFFVNSFSVQKKRIIVKNIFDKLKQLFNPGKPYPKYGLPNNHCDQAIVYGKSDLEYLTKVNGFEISEVHIGSYPFMLPEEHLKGSKQIEETKTKVFYISSALRASKVIPISEKQEFEFYHKLIRIVTELGFQLSIKLHPIEILSKFEKELEGYSNFKLYKDSNLADLTMEADIVIGDYSTALLYPVKYKKPIILLQSEFFKKYPFDYSDFGIGVKTSLKNLKTTLEKKYAELNFDPKTYDNFIDSFIGSNKETAYDVFFKAIQ